MDSTVAPGSGVGLGLDGTENSAAASSSVGGQPPTLVVQYNGLGPDVAVNGWSWSEDGGANWQDCQSTLPCPSVCCAAGAATGDPAIPLAAELNWAGDPVLTAGAPGQVVMLNMAGPPKNTHEQVVASLSLDGGRTFLATERVNNLSGDCGGGSQDQPHATFDMGTSPPTLWVLWRHNGTGTFGGCVRGGTIDASDPSAPSITWLGPAQTVDNMDRDDDSYGQGGMLIVARTVGQSSRISVMYSNTDHQFDDCSGGKRVAWDTVTSDNLGADWYAPVRIEETNDFDWCAAGDHVALGLREFWFALDESSGDYWAVVNPSPSRLNVHVSRDEGASWTLAKRILAPGRTLFQPNIAVDSAGRVMVTYWQEQGFRVQRMAMAFGTPGGRWSSQVALTTPFESGPGQSSNGGDYQSTISVPSGALPGGSTFFAAWSQSLVVQTRPLAVSP